jgi:hypothetical protein
VCADGGNCSDNSGSSGGCAVAPANSGLNLGELGSMFLGIAGFLAARKRRSSR